MIEVVNHLAFLPCSCIPSWQFFLVEQELSGSPPIVVDACGRGAEKEDLVSSGIIPLKEKPH
jgi:hypothetical protein